MENNKKENPNKLLVIVVVFLGLIVLGYFAYRNGNVNNPFTKKGECIVSGCSGEICADREMASTCELKPGSECYKNATCERQQNGKCGWTENQVLKTCLGSY